MLSSLKCGQPKADGDQSPLQADCTKRKNATHKRSTRSTFEVPKIHGSNPSTRRDRFSKRLELRQYLFIQRHRSLASEKNVRKPYTCDECNLCTPMYTQITAKRGYAHEVCRLRPARIANGDARYVQENAGNSGALNGLQMIQYTGTTLPDPFFSPAFLFYATATLS
ncbi:hypothetical protein EVAR_27145_1 [Eumeta japonica]|uniref:Uncharacterized protein n=1 Tax=Eumeta variegata TaxID=151549 RepID=A0A4C1W1I7_EUMVA|nr:hypothetical protein EVAR_27145_1 [Eumeta japonica]